MKKRIFLMLIACIMCFTQVSVFATTDYLTDYINELSDINKDQDKEIDDLKKQLEKAQSASSTIVLVSNPRFDLLPGQTKNVELTLINMSAGRVDSLIITPLPEGDNAKDITVKVLDNTDSVNSLSSKNTTKLKLQISASANAKSGSYSIGLKYVYSDAAKVNYVENTDKFIMYVMGENVGSAIGLSNFNLSVGSMTPDNTATLSFDVKNVGRKSVSNVQVSLDGLSSDGISLKNSSSNFYFASLSASDTKKVTFNLFATSNVDEGNYPLTVTATYLDSDNKEQKTEYTYFVSVLGSGTSSKSALKLTNVKYPTNTQQAEQDFTVSFDLMNTSGITAKDIKITAKTDVTSIIPKSASILTLDSLAAGDGKHMDFRFSSTSSAKTQNHSIEFIVEFEDGTKSEGKNNVISYSQYVGVNVSNPDADDDDKKSKPRIIVSEYKAEPLNVKAGEEFDLTMSFLNTHSEKTVKNIKMYLTMFEEKSSDSDTTGNIFTPVNASNTFFVDTINPKGTSSKTLRLYTAPDAQPKNYTLTVNFEYEDSDNNEYTATELLGINVTQPVKIETTEIVMPKDVGMGEPIFLSFEIRNTGNVKANNMTINLATEFEADSKSTYLSNFDPGQSEYYENTLYANMEGQQTVIVNIEYDTPKGEHVIEPYEFTVNVMPPMDMGDMGMMPEEMPPEKPQGLNINPTFIGIGVLVLAAAGFAFYKWKKAKDLKRMFLDE